MTIRGTSVDDNKDLKEVWWLLTKGTSIFLLIGAFLGGCAYINRSLNLPNDNVIEQSIEAVIDSKLDLPPGSIDLTPN